MDMMIALEVPTKRLHCTTTHACKTSIFVFFLGAHDSGLHVTSLGYSEGNNRVTELSCINAIPRHIFVKLGLA